jgi:hypothetical protein
MTGRRVNIILRRGFFYFQKQNNFAGSQLAFSALPLKSVYELFFTKKKVIFWLHTLLRARKKDISSWFLTDLYIEFCI